MEYGKTAHNTRYMLRFCPNWLAKLIKNVEYIEVILMNIKLISPKMSLRPMDSVFKRLLSPPLSLVTIATLTPKEHRVWIEDENAGKIWNRHRSRKYFGNSS